MDLGGEEKEQVLERLGSEKALGLVEQMALSLHVGEGSISILRLAVVLESLEKLYISSPFPTSTEQSDPLTSLSGRRRTLQSRVADHSASTGKGSSFPQCR